MSFRARFDSIAVFFTESKRPRPASSLPKKKPPRRYKPQTFSSREVRNAKRGKRPEEPPPSAKASPSRIAKGRLVLGRLVRMATRNTKDTRDDAPPAQDSPILIDQALAESNEPLDNFKHENNTKETDDTSPDADATEGGDGKGRTSIVAKIMSGITYLSSRRRSQPEPCSSPTLSEEERQELVEFGGHRGMLSDRGEDAPRGPGPSTWWTNRELWNVPTWTTDRTDQIQVCYQFDFLNKLSCLIDGFDPDQLSSLARKRHTTLRPDAFGNPMVISEIHGDIIHAFPITSIQDASFAMETFSKDQARQLQYLVIEHSRGQLSHDDAPIFQKQRACLSTVSLSRQINALR
ncbi:hypothetical protein H2199_001338 [Coniosporium tulheliwenetii]|uniref:Uncharacterized protein n=1 Tax=Coniosporium tulheliwenetii TaxID=3383036 RepID=A0ACC2ZLM1_9PEZI|nr:hypothetical protein H2199_001338 [Cladosporium sp. JES 115]